MKIVYKVTVDTDKVSESVGLNVLEYAYLLRNYREIMTRVWEHIMNDVLPNEIKYHVRNGLDKE